MKKIYSLAITSIVAFSLAGCMGGSNSLTPAASVKLDQREVCNVSKLGIETVLANAKVYNAAAIKEKVEFRRLCVNNSDLIIAVEEGLKAKATTVTPNDFKKKPTKDKFPIEYAAHRACTFGLSALQQKHEGKSTWRLAVPGDGYKY
jgi:PBP1b-binding outer membrane lipoprotein LpoB